MATLSKYKVLIAGILSPLAAVVLYVLVYGTLTSLSTDLEKDWLRRLSLATLAMIVPFVITIVLARKDYRNQTLSRSSKIGLALAILSLGLAWKPVERRHRPLEAIAEHGDARRSCAVIRHRGSSRKRAATKRPKRKGRAGQHLGDLVRTLPRGDAETRSAVSSTAATGVRCVGLSDEDVNLQQKFVEQVHVTYPLLTLKGNVPGSIGTYRVIQPSF